MAMDERVEIEMLSYFFHYRPWKKRNSRQFLEEEEEEEFQESKDRSCMNQAKIINADLFNMDKLNVVLFSHWTDICRQELNRPFWPSQL